MVHTLPQKVFPAPLPVSAKDKGEVSLRKDICGLLRTIGFGSGMEVSFLDTHTI
jgi:hypothetical protein